MEKNYKSREAFACCYTCEKGVANDDYEWFCTRDSYVIIPIGVCDLYLTKYPSVPVEDESQRGELIDLHVRALDKLMELSREIRDRLDKIR